MYQLLETIKVKYNALQHISYHTERVNYSRSALFDAEDKWDLTELIDLPELDYCNVYKCRFLYSKTIEKIEFQIYIPRIVRKLYLVTDETIDYSFKYADRDALNKIKNLKTTDPDADILIVRHGLITDTSFSNIAFWDGSEWLTPDSPLLKGTKRAWYLEKEILIEKKITPSDLSSFEKARLINAMLDLEDGEDIDIEDIDIEDIIE